MAILIVLKNHQFPGSCVFMRRYIKYETSVVEGSASQRVCDYGCFLKYFLFKNI